MTDHVTQAAELVERIDYILDPTASASERMHRRSHLTNRDLRTIRAALSAELAARSGGDGDMKMALDWALCVLGQYEPGDSRAVSDEFVAALSISSGIEGRRDECRSILQAAISSMEAPSHG